MSALLGANGLQIGTLVVGAAVLIVCGLSAFVTACCCIVSGRCSRDEEREIAEAELAAHLMRNRHPAKTLVRTSCIGCGREVDRQYVDYRADLGHVYVRPVHCFACRAGSREKIEIDLDQYPDAASLRAALESLDGRPVT